MRNTDAYYNELMKKTGGDAGKALHSYVLGRTDEQLANVGVDRQELLRRLGASKPSSGDRGMAAKLGTFAGKVFDYLARPLYATANVFKDMADTDAGNGFHPWESFKRGLSGQDKTTFYDVLKASQGNNYVSPQKDTLFKVIGFGLDLLAPPTGFASGLTRLGKLANIVKGGQEIAGGSRLAGKIAKYSPEALKLGQTAAEQAALGQRSLINYWGIPLIPGKVSAPVYQAAEKIGQGAGNAAGGVPALAAAARLFNKDFKAAPEALAARDMSKYYDRLENVRKQEAVDQARELAEKQKRLMEKYGLTKGELFNKLETIRKTPVTKASIAPRPAAPGSYRVVSPAEKFDRVWQVIKQDAERMTAVPTARSKLAEFVWNGLGGVKSGIGKDEVRRLKRADLEELAKQVKLPAVEEAVAKSAQQRGIDLDKLFDLANTTTREMINKARDASRLARAAGASEIPRKTIDDMAREPVDIQDFLKRIHAINEQYIKKEKELGIPISELRDDRLNYMMHVLTPELRKEFGDKAFRSKLSEGLKKWLQDRYGVAADPSGHSILTPAQIERKYKMPVEDVNRLAREGRLHEGRVYDQFFMDDPAAVMAYRGLLHARALSHAEFLTRAAAEFGVDSASAPAGYRQVKGRQFGELLDGKAFHPEVAAIIERRLKFFDDPDETLKGAADLYDLLLGVWKKITLVPIPSYHLRNIAGNVWMNFLGGVAPQSKSYVDAVKILKGAGGSVRTAAGKTFTYDELRRLAEVEGITHKGWFTAEVEQIMEETLPRAGGRLDNLVGIKQGIAIQRWVENVSRYAHFVEKIKRGYSPEQAAQSVKKFLFDMENLTEFEKTTMRRLFPFYAWSRHNIPLELEALFTQPGKFSLPAKAMADVERHKEDRHGRPDEAFMGDWLKEGLPVYYGIKDGKGLYAMMKYWFPGADVQQAAQPFEWAMESLSPFIKMPAELVFNTSLYFDQPIDKYGDFGEQTANFLGMNLPTRIVYPMRSGFRVLNELDKLNPGSVFGQRKFQPPEEQRWLNALTGMKLYAYDPAWEGRLYRNDLQKQATRMKYDYRKAVEEGNADQAAKLEKLYEQLKNDPRTKALESGKAFYGLKEPAAASKSAQQANPLMQREAAEQYKTLLRQYKNWR
ncbi:MAG: H-NS histone family protein [Peptococcaceae bacterium]|nr:H-NS histone family protein [Peptococcaceae bacterium]